MSGPASGCFRCHANGVVSFDQRNAGASPYASWRTGNRECVRFYCPGCLHVWTTNLDDAIQHGEFLDRAGIRT